MGLSAEEERTYPVDRAKAYDGVVQALQQMPKVKVRTADPASGHIEAGTKISLMSWGEKLLVDVFELSPGQTVVKVRSQLKAQLVDWGANKKNVAGVFQAVEQALGTTAQA
jgi:uncharacterized protein (DUF1499 family)